MRRFSKPNKDQKEDPKDPTEKEDGDDLETPIEFSISNKQRSTKTKTAKKKHRKFRKMNKNGFLNLKNPAKREKALMKKKKGILMRPIGSPIKSKVRIKRGAKLPEGVKVRMEKTGFLNLKGLERRDIESENED